MPEPRDNEFPKVQSAGAGGPPAPPKRTALDQDDESPDPVPVRIPDPVSMKDLATALARRPVEIAVDLMMQGRLSTSVESLIDFDTASKIVRYYGYAPKKIG